MSTKRANAKLTVLTKEDKRLLLTQLKEMETQHGCKCKNCIMKEIPLLAYKIARKYKRNYPETWNRNKQAEQMWVKYFVDTYKDEISKFLSVCKNKMSTNRANESKPTISKNHSEDKRLLLTLFAKTVEMYQTNKADNVRLTILTE